MATPSKHHVRKSVRRHRRKPIPTFVGRIVGALVGCLLAGVLTMPAYNAIVQPYRLRQQLGTEVALLETRLAKKRQENTQLQQRIEYLKSPEGLEVLAREVGYHRASETVFLMPRSSAGKPTSEK